MTATTPPLGSFGVWRSERDFSADLARDIERMGYGAIWLGGASGDLTPTAEALAATERITIATGIVNVWRYPADEVARAYHRVAAEHPDRFILGIGVGHPESTSDYTHPYDALVRYLDVLDAEGVPREHLMLAALGKRVLELARDRTAGAHPYLVPPEHTAFAREILGEGSLLAPEHMVVVESEPDPERSIARPAVAKPYLGLTNYVSNLERLGFPSVELADGGSDRVIDALVAQGTAAEVAAKLREHLAAGADHVSVQALPRANDPRELLAALARELL